MRGDLGKYLAPFSTFIIAIWGAVRPDDEWWLGWSGLFFFGSLLLGIAAMLLQRWKPTYGMLKEDLEHVRRVNEQRGEAVEQTLQTLLQILATHCGADQQSDRVSAYYFYENEFVMIARYSRNPEFSVAGRIKYAIDSGVIGEAWRLVEGIQVRTFPPTRKAWLRRMGASGLASWEAENLTMQSVMIAAMRIESGGRSVGMLVFESIEENSVGFSTLDRAKGSLMFQAIADFVEARSPLTPRAEVTGIGEPSSLFDHKWKRAKDT